MTAHKVVWIVGLVVVHLGAVVGLAGGYLNATTPAADGADIGAGVMEGMGTLLLIAGVVLEVVALVVRASRRAGPRARGSLTDPPFPPVG